MIDFSDVIQHHEGERPLEALPLAAKRPSGRPTSGDSTLANQAGQGAVLSVLMSVWLCCSLRWKLPLGLSGKGENLTVTPHHGFVTYQVPQYCHTDVFSPHILSWIYLCVRVTVLVHAYRRHGMCYHCCVPSGRIPREEKLPQEKKRGEGHSLLLTHDPSSCYINLSALHSAFVKN